MELDYRGVDQTLVVNLSVMQQKINELEQKIEQMQETIDYLKTFH